jgi:gluconokinase
MLILVMGVAGSGKTLIGGMLAESLHYIFADADQFHPAANIEKMSHGVPLTDADRQSWLLAMRQAIEAWTKSGQDAVLGCSALKQSYRDLLTAGVPATIVYLKGSPELIYTRLLQRHNHFMKPQMLSSQFADLEEPRGAIVIDIAHTPDQIVTGNSSQISDT